MSYIIYFSGEKFEYFNLVKLACNFETKHFILGKRKEEKNKLSFNQLSYQLYFVEFFNHA